MMVSDGSVKMEDGKVSCETPEGTVINININQRSCMDSLMDAIKDNRTANKDGQGKEPVTEIAAKESPSVAYLGVGVSLMSLGFIIAMLAIVIEVAHPQLYVMFYGTFFWVGFPILVSGALNIVAYKYYKAIWVVIAFISLMGCLAVSIAGLVYVALDIDRLSWGFNMEYLCDAIRKNPYDYRTAPPTTAYYYDIKKFDLERCRIGFRQYKNFTYALLIMCLVMMIWGILVSAITLVYRMKMFCGACRYEKVVDREDPVLQSNSPKEIVV